jgi:cytochrome c oxidase assembly protein subunit 15
VTGFAITVVMWGLGFVFRLPALTLPSPVLGGLMLGCLVAGGAAAGRLTRYSWRAGLGTGLVAATLDLMILGSLLGGRQPGEVERSRLLAQILGGDAGGVSGLWWVPCWLLCGAALGAVGSGLVARLLPAPAPHRPPVNWPCRMANVTVGSTLLLLFVGGVVTSKEAGMAVPDWPRTSGYLMFLFPLSRMTGGVYYEHTHRLLGCLTGLCAITLVVYLLVRDRRPFLRWLGPLVVLAVVTQGVLGGLRVTEDARTLAAVHGVLGQVVLCLVVSLAVVTTRTWREPHRLPAAGAGVDVGLSQVLAAAILLQLVLGGLLRHLDSSMTPHIVLAMPILLLGTCVGLRMLGLYQAAPTLVRAGVTVAGMIWVQVCLGIVTLAATAPTRGQGLAPRLADVVLSTAHQTLGASILAGVVVLILLCRRLLEPTVPAAAR